MVHRTRKEKALVKRLRLQRAESGKYKNPRFIYMPDETGEDIIYVRNRRSGKGIGQSYKTKTQLKKEKKRLIKNQLLQEKQNAAAREQQLQEEEEGDNVIHQVAEEEEDNIIQQVEDDTKDEVLIDHNKDDETNDHPNLNDLKSFLLLSNKVPNTTFSPSHQNEWMEFKEKYVPGQVLTPPLYDKNDGYIPYSLFQNYQTYYCNGEMMSDFTRLIAFTEWCGSSITGVCKIKPYPEYTPMRNGYESLLTIENPVVFEKPMHQTVKKSKSGIPLYQVTFNEKNNDETFSIQKFFEYCLEINQTPAIGDVKDIFWRYLEEHPCIYCKDKLATFFDSDQTVFNLDNLQTIFLEDGEWDKNNPMDGSGLIHSYAYLASFGTAFSEHTEDHECGSINYLHVGHPKMWRVVSPKFGIKLYTTLHKLARKEFPKLTGCPYVTRHKLFLPSNEILNEYGIPFVEVTQEPGDFIITSPFASHSGFNTGFNLAEASNFIGCGASWVQRALFSFHCNQNKCQYGTNTHLKPDVWFKKLLTEEDYNLWENNKLFGRHPDAIPYGQLQKVGKGIQNRMPRYPVDPKYEDLETALRIRKIFKNEEDIITLQKIDLEKEIEAMKNSELLDKKRCSQETAKRKEKKLQDEIAEFTSKKSSGF